MSEILRTLAKGDPSVALVSSMHPAVLSFWLCQDQVPEPFTEAWKSQKELVAQVALNGGWWGTITSEPGSGGDVLKTKAVAQPTDHDGYKISGQKHFGSGSGITSYMITTAISEGEGAADWFFMNVDGAKWDGSAGIKLISEWDGHGMIATQSHAFDFSNYSATRIAWPDNLRTIAAAAGPFISSIFTAVIVGVAEAAFEAARAQIFKRRDDLKPYEQVEWARVENEAWIMHAAYESMLRAVETKGANAAVETLHAKTAVAEIAESMTARICRITGGGSFHRASHFGWAFEDVRALGFLRPPWSLAFEAALQRTWDQLEQMP
ncbi:MAG: hypothetical protein GEU75_16095 [Dehalococcoidia bacterium]|nr:hypothetical protein [Dehalococcoidia bacterium]